MKLTDYVAQRLSTEVDHAFVGNGGVVLHLLDSLYHQQGIKLIPMQTEQGAAIAAESYARMHGFGVAIATSGPGFCNLIQGIACAYYDSIPTLFIVGGVPRAHKKQYGELRQFGFQEMQVTDIVQSFTKRAITVHDPSSIFSTLDYLIALAKEGRPGPVVLELPDDVQRAQVFERKGSYILPKPLPVLQGQINSVVRSLRACRRPIIIAGAGSRACAVDVIRLAGRLRTQIIPTWATKDIYPNAMPCAGIAGSSAGNKAMQEADLVLAIGARLDTHQIGSSFASWAPGAQKIVLDIDKQELAKYPYTENDLLIHTDARMFISILASDAHLKRRSIWVPWKSRCEKLRAEHAHPSTEVYNLFKTIDANRQSGDIVITDAGATLTWTMQVLTAKEGMRLYSAFNHSPMGYALPAAIGAQFAFPHRRVVCISGDGGFAMNSQELATIHHHKLPIRIIIIDNNGYGIIKQTQDAWLKGVHVCADPEHGLPMPNALRVAKAYGVQVTVHVINERAQIKPKLKWGERLEEIG